MQPDGMAPGSPGDWLRHARSDLAIARAFPLRGALIEALCFHAQQAAEKAIKAVLIAKGIAPPHTHNIGSLIDRLPSEVVVPFDLHEVSGLTDFAVTARYPGEIEPITEEEYHDAVKLAEAVVLWAEAFTGK
ncbi:MAG: HEPN domain-containing protein, partial [Gammaproteobacteria bacterium]